MNWKKSLWKGIKPVLVAGALGAGAAFASTDFGKSVEGAPTAVLVLLPVLQLAIHTALDAYKHRGQ